MARTSTFNVIFGAKDNTRGAFGSVNRNLRSLGSNAQAATRVLGSALAFTGVALGVKGIQQLSDDYTVLNNRVRLFTNSNAEAAAVQKELFDLSNRTRSSVSATTEVYQRLAQANSTLGLSQKEILTVTENINKAVRVSGVEASSARQALIQLGQGIASGQLRGQELNSVLEQTPRVAQQIANELGVGIGQIRDLAIEGKITSDVIISAFTNVGTLNEEFSRLGITFGEAFTVIQNEALRAVGEISSLAGGSKNAANAIRDLGTNLIRAFTGIVLDSIVIIKTETAQWLSLLREIPKGVNDLKASFGSLTNIDGLEKFSDIFANLPANIRFAVTAVRSELVASFDTLVERARTANEQIRTIFTFDLSQGGFSGLADELERIGTQGEKNLASVEKLKVLQIDQAGLERDFAVRANDEQKLRLQNERQLLVSLRDQNRERLLALQAGGASGQSNLPVATLNETEQRDRLREAAKFVKENFEEILQTQDISILGGDQLNLDEFNKTLEKRLEASKRFTTSEIDQEREKQQGILNELNLGLEQRLLTEEDFNSRRQQLLETALSSLSEIEIPNSGESGNGSIFSLIPGLGSGDQADRLQTELDNLQSYFEDYVRTVQENAAILNEVGIDAGNLEIQAEQQKQEELKRIEKRGIDARRKQKLDDARNGLSAARDFARALITITDTQNRTLFNIQKAASLALAVINTAEAVSEALPNFPLAAAVAAAGAAEIATIASTTIGGGSGSRGGVGGTGTGSSDQFLGQETDGFIDANPASGPRQEVNITIEGNAFSGDQIRELLEEINEQIGDGTTITPAFT